MNRPMPCPRAMSPGWHWPTGCRRLGMVLCPIINSSTCFKTAITPCVCLYFIRRVTVWHGAWEAVMREKSYSHLPGQKPSAWFTGRQMLAELANGYGLRQDAMWGSSWLEISSQRRLENRRLVTHRTDAATWMPCALATVPHSWHTGEWRLLNQTRFEFWLCHSYLWEP